MFAVSQNLGMTEVLFPQNWWWLATTKYQKCFFNICWFSSPALSGHDGCVEILLEHDHFKKFSGNRFSPLHCAVWVPCWTDQCWMNYQEWSQKNVLASCISQIQTAFQNFKHRSHSVWVNIRILHYSVRWHHWMVLLLHQAVRWNTVR